MLCRCKIKDNFLLKNLLGMLFKAGIMTDMKPHESLKYRKIRDGHGVFQLAELHWPVNPGQANNSTLLTHAAVQDYQSTGIPNVADNSIEISRWDLTR